MIKGYLNAPKKGCVVSLEKQEKSLNKYASLVEQIELQIFRDSTEAPLCNRQELYECVWSCKQGDVIAVHSAAILSDSQLQVHAFEYFLQQRGLQLFCIKDRHSSSIKVNMEKELRFYTLYHYEKLQHYFTKKTRNSEPEITVKGPTPYGKKRVTEGKGEKKKYYFVEDPFEQANITLMQEMRLQGMSYKEIRDELNIRKVKPRRGSEWDYHSVYRVMERYPPPKDHPKTADHEAQLLLAQSLSEALDCKS